MGAENAEQKRIKNTDRRRMTYQRRASKMTTGRNAKTKKTRSKEAAKGQGLTVTSLEELGFPGGKHLTLNMAARNVDKNTKYAERTR